ncbi:histone-lysine N-methyltransferase SETDB1-B-like [Enoplosus armatus]|uniref:histone-lysine N-methyltransferase SETDB1-B-like n=1 Tax=Enoplosus armatus TaxID=215367 RepID=UPI0039913993
MEEDEMEMSKEELQKWIREKVKKNKLNSTDVLEKCSLLQSLLERREKQAARLQKLCESVAACEEIVKKQYSLLGWDYRDTDSDDDDNITGCGKMEIIEFIGNASLSSREFVDAETPAPSSSATTRLLPKLEDSQILNGDNGKKSYICRKRKPVVVLTRLSTLSTLCQSNDEAIKTPPRVPEGEISVNMNILARRRAMSWQQGEIIEIVTKEDGRLKYKISFEDKGKSLVSGHHIAFDCMPNMKQLFVGARVVAKCQADWPQFCPGVLAELPSRRNRMRFLVFIDDHTPVYVGIPLLHLVCRPLTDPLDDIPDGTHKNFLMDYIKAWPYLPLIQYRVGQIINVELNGVQQRCEVQEVDCSLIQVVFQIP